MKHSPAPWRVVTFDPKHSDPPELRDANNNIVCAVSFVSDPDAALIAAAPDLLEACKFALECLELAAKNDNYGHWLDSDWNIIRSAIAKADGNVLTQTETK